jgi:Holliday junction resolvase RusA-like endonuclease
LRSTRAGWLSPSVEEEYKLLARDYDNAQKNYQDDLAKKARPI